MPPSKNLQVRKSEEERVPPDRRLHDCVTCVETVACCGPALHLVVVIILTMIIFIMVVMTMNLQSSLLAQKQEMMICLLDHFYSNVKQ